MPPARRISHDAIRFGTIIARLRRQRGWTKAKLAQRSGMHVTYIGTIERGGNVPSLETILELAEVLGADVGEIMRELAAARNPAPLPPQPNTGGAE